MGDYVFAVITNILLFQRYRTKAVVEIVQMFRLHPKECRHVLVIWKCCGQTNKATVIMGLLDLPQCSETLTSEWENSKKSRITWIFPKSLITKIGCL